MRPRITALWIGLAAAMAGGAVRAETKPVDLALVLAVDVSESVDYREAMLQRTGYIDAMADPQVIQEILSGPYGRIAATYLEWGGLSQHLTVIDWQIIDSAEAALAFSNRLKEASIARGGSTSISDAIRYSMARLGASGVDADHRVIDISGDGPNNTGGLVSTARDEAVAAGITINGVAINNTTGELFSLADLDVYYRECVIGGPGSFVIAADGFELFAEAIRRKLILEVAGRTPSTPNVVLVQATTKPGQKYAPACDIGERMRYQDNPAPH